MFEKVSGLLSKPLSKFIASQNSNIISSLYRGLLRRDPDNAGLTHFIKRMNDGTSLEETIREIINSDEFALNYVSNLGDRFGAHTDDIVLGHLQSNKRLHAIHRLRCELIATMLPSAELAIDLGGAAAGDERGALLLMGYAHRPKLLYIIDLPPEKRVASATPQKGLKVEKSSTFEGVSINYLYQSMGDLSNFDEACADFVWSGESIEHVPIEVADAVFHSVFRVLKPGGIFALDTPNRLLTRLQVGDHNFIHFEHFTEYFFGELVKKALDCGFIIRRTKGLILMSESVKENRFIYREFMDNCSINDNPEESYIFYLELEKPRQI